MDEVISHLEIGQELRRRIQTAQYGPGQRIPPERELLEEFKCSRLTVAKAMAPLVVDGLIERHRGRGTFVAREAGDVKSVQRFTVNPARRGNVIKYISPGLEANVRSSRDDVLAALHSALDRAGYHVSVDFYSGVEQHLSCLDKAVSPQIAGVVLWPEADPRTVKAVGRLVQESVPLVLIDTYLPGLDCDYVVTDNIEGASAMVGHLAELGHRRIVYLTPPAIRTSLRDRMAGFLRGMVESQLPVSSDSVVMLDASVTLPGAEQPNAPLAMTLGTLLARSPRPTAWFVANDSIALSILALLRARGVTVPADVTVVGYDGIAAGAFNAVPLTTVRQDFPAMADVAARILLERFDGRPHPLRYHRFIEPQLVVRASSAPPRALG